ncbi:MAG: hypothetical protein M0T84_17255 [Betaproteobacteria bacterium]|nr:hypothetical protein [Betaproteobacteria bacterium]
MPLGFCQGVAEALARVRREIYTFQLRLVIKSQLAKGPAQKGKLAIEATTAEANGQM